MHSNRPKPPLRQIVEINCAAGERRHFQVPLPHVILVLAPHADDELISCGGTILKYTQWNCEVAVIVATSGSGGDPSNRTEGRIALARRGEFEAAKEALRLSDRSEFLGLDELHVNRDTVRMFTDRIRDIQPDIVLMPHPNDRHRAHRNTALVAMEALFHAPTKAYKGKGREWLPMGAYFYETLSGIFGEAMPTGPLVISDVTEQFNTKTEILKKIYVSQSDLLSAYQEWVEVLGRFRGITGRCKFGEAFYPDTTHVPLKLLLV